MIKSFEKFSEELQEEIYASYLQGQLERASFPFKGEIADGVIFKTEDSTFLIPLQSIKASRLGTADDDEDVENTDDIEGGTDDLEVEEEAEEPEDFDDEE